MSAFPDQRRAGRFAAVRRIFGIDLELRNRLHGHAMTDVGSVHYDRWDYLPEKQEAIEKWSEWLKSLIGQDG